MKAIVYKPFAQPTEAISHIQAGQQGHDQSGTITTESISNLTVLAAKVHQRSGVLE
jgi:hypothetical protein